MRRRAEIVPQLAFALTAPAFAGRAAKPYLRINRSIFLVFAELLEAGRQN